MISERDLLEIKPLRDEMAARVEVLDKVKKLLLIPEINVMTTKMIADYYEVELNVVQTCFGRHKQEFSADGSVLKPVGEMKEFWNSLGVNFKNNRGHCEVQYGGMSIKMPNSGVRCFPKRAILRFGMLLRDSEIAQEVRTQLLNLAENSSDKQKTLDIDEELTLAGKIGQAIMSGDIDEIVRAVGEAMDYKNRHITRLETENAALAHGNLHWLDRSTLNYAVRKLSCATNMPCGKVWNELYRELKYKYGMDLKRRGPAPFVQYVKDCEWQNVIRTFSAMCHVRQIDVSKTFQ